MNAILYRARAELRARWRAWLSLALIFGIFAGVAMTAAAGARRTKDAYPRFLQEANAFDIFLGDFSQFSPVFWKVDFDALAALPYVEELVRMRYFPGDGNVEVLGSEDPAFGTQVNKARIVEGRAPRGVDEVVLPFSPRTLEKMKVGQEVEASFFTSEQMPEKVKLKIVGRSLSPGDLPPTDILGDMFIPSKEFVARYKQRFMSVEGAMITFKRGGLDVDRFRADTARLSAGKVVSPFVEKDYSENVQRSFDVQAIALWAVAALIGLVGVLLVAQTISRQILLEDDDEGILRAIGMTRGMTIGGTAFHGLLLGLIGAAVATAIAIAASPLFPRGQAGAVDPDPGVRVDALVIGLGAAGTLMLAMALTVPVAFIAARLRRADREAARGSRIARMLSRLGVGPTVVAGTRLALERGSGRTAVPVRSSISAITIGLAALLAIFTFGASLDRLLTTPAIYGVGWDHVYGFEDSRSAETSLDAIADDPAVSGVATASSGVSMLVGDEAMEGIAYARVSGDVFVPPQRGRLPGKGEVYLGPGTAATLGVDIGDLVPISVQGARTMDAKLVGIGVLPPVSETSKFGGGLLLHDETLMCLSPGSTDERCTIDPSLLSSDLIVNLREGVEVPAEIERLRKKLKDPSQDQYLFTTRGADLISFGRVDDVPLILAGLIVLVAGGALTHILVTAVRRRQRDLAILRTLGLLRGQTRRVVAWQATVICLIALAIAIPIGIASGRALWSMLATRIGVVPSPAVHWTSVWLAIPCALVAANLIAAFPGRAAARTQPASALREE